MSFTHKLFSLVALAAAALSVTNALILSEQCGAPLADPYHWDIKNDPGLQSRKAEFLNGGNCAIVRAFDQSGQRAVAGEQDAWSPYSSWYFPNAATYWCNTEPTLGQVNYKTFTQLRPEGQGDISYIVYSGLKPLDSAEYTTVTQVRFIWRDETAGKAIEKAHPNFVNQLITKYNTTFDFDPIKKPNSPAWSRALQNQFWPYNAGPGC